MNPQMIKLGFDGVLNLAGAMSGRNFAKAQFKAREAEIAANKVIREANNKAKAAHGSLLRYKDVLSKRIMAKNYGHLQSTLATNLVRSGNNNLAVRQYLGIQEAENDGALAASMAASGVGGGTADQLQYVSSLRFAERARQLQRTSEVEQETLRNQLDSTYESFVNNQGINYTDDGLSFLEEVNQETIPSMGTQLFKAFVKTIGSNAGNLPDMFGGGGTEVGQGTEVAKSFFNITPDATTFGSAIVGL